MEHFGYKGDEFQLWLGIAGCRARGLWFSIGSNDILGSELQ